jgi:hypothetical protein
MLMCTKQPDQTSTSNAATCGVCAAQRPVCQLLNQLLKKIFVPEAIAIAISVLKQCRAPVVSALRSAQ